MGKLQEQFEEITNKLDQAFLTAPLIHQENWQSIKAPMPMAEVFNTSFVLDLDGCESVPELRDTIKPNLPWADTHFITERISGLPINPGESYKIWQNGRAAKDHLKEGEKFDHSYAERYWPKDAEDGRLTGHRHPIGDLWDLIKGLEADPLTRQAYLPIFYPEDVGAVAQGGIRVPCTLGYHFIMRDEKLHCVYPMRSCDYMLHFRDDVYLTIRLQLWILQQLRMLNDRWNKVDMGSLKMDITSLHMFEIHRTNLRHKLSYKGDRR